MCFGCLSAYILAFSLGDDQWRVSITISAVVAALQLLGITVMLQESPPWLESQGRHDDAHRARALLYMLERGYTGGHAGGDTESDHRTLASPLLLPEDSTDTSYRPKEEEEEGQGLKQGGPHQNSNLNPNSNENENQRAASTSVSSNNRLCETLRALYEARKHFALALAIATAHAATFANTVVLPSPSCLVPCEGWS